MGEREADSSSSLAGGSENELESIVVHKKNDANTAVPLSENEKNWLESFVNGESFKNQHEVIWTKIERVPAMLSEVKENSGSYDPLYVEADLKLLEELYQKVRRMVEAAKQCYTDQSSVAKFNNEEFSQMMFLDACFLLQFIYCIVREERAALKMKSNMIALVKPDLFLLENQIPFQLLNELSFESKFGDENSKQTMLNNFATQIRSFSPQSYKKNMNNVLSNLAFGGRKGVQDVNVIAGTFESEPAHLLDLIRTNLFDKTV
ncbi:hypothetical protein Pint_20099 [Pistacia integerrima]|uniref:Uncharacterized protein n=1 Tax=Pistacia integerrima TaxID=434235 RepID=A0ACC0XEL9_9ROSI|nr:hypothetical protein Pint_20099 [Pistacia integerrima]